MVGPLAERRRPTDSASVLSLDTPPPAPSPPSVKPAVNRMPDGRALNPLERIRLVAEILKSYIRARRTMRRSPIEAAVHTLRQDARTVPLDTSQALHFDARPSSIDGAHPQTLSEAHRLGRAVQRTLTFAPGDTRCLTRSLVLTQLLARRGISARLVIGARTTPSFLAHAWVECSGQPVLPPGDGSFGRLVEL